LLYPDDYCAQASDVYAIDAIWMNDDNDDDVDVLVTLELLGTALATILRHTPWIHNRSDHADPYRDIVRICKHLQGTMIDYLNQTSDEDEDEDERSSHLLFSD
jgi:hypothetical protein